MSADAARTNAKTAVIYLRVSTVGQVNTAVNREGYSLPAQRDICTRYATSLAAEVIAEYVEPGKSARSTNRPALQRMLTELSDLRPTTSSSTTCPVLPGTSSTPSGCCARSRRSAASSNRPKRTSTPAPKACSTTPS